MIDTPPRLQDPRTKYPTPPFPKQQQPAPGLASEMTPRPDHGEESYRGSGRLLGRKALITGGDSGIGRAVAIAFAREGADVAIAYLPSEESDARAVEELVKNAGHAAVLIPGDIRDEAFCKDLVRRAAERLGGLDILVNNAAKQHNVPSIVDVTTQQFDETLKTNLYALFWVTQAAVPLLPPGSTIVNTTSVQAYTPSAGLLAYSMTKAGIAAFTKSLSREVIEKGIRVNAVAPGPFWTALQPAGGQPPGKLEKLGTEVPLGRPGQPVEASPIYVFLASQDSSFVTGEVYGVTGGKGLV